jgi:putative transposase
MSTQTDVVSDSGDAVEAALPEGLAEQLLAAAKAQGVALTGPGGLPTGLTRQVLQTALETELTDHLGHEHGGTPAGENGRNGHSPKTVRTEIGPVTVKVPRDRAGTFEPVLVPKHARRLTGFDEAVVSLYAKGVTTGDIAAHLQDIDGDQVSRDLVSRVTDAVVEEMQAWQARPLEPVYPVLLIDAIYLRVRDGQVANRPVYVAMGITVDGVRDVLGFWVGPAGGEGARHWLTMLTELKNPMIDRRGGRADRLLRRSQGPARRPHRGLAGSHGPVLRRPLGSQLAALRAQAALGEGVRRAQGGLHQPQRRGRRGQVRRLRRDLATEVPRDDRDVGAGLARVRPVPRLYPIEIRKLIYTTNGIESLNARFRQAARRRGHFPTCEYRGVLLRSAA